MNYTFSVYRRLIPLTLAAVASSCIDEISADLPAPGKKLVLNTILTPDSALRVQVSRVTGPTDSSSRVLSSAQVWLHRTAGGPEALQPLGKGLYALPVKPSSALAYTLSAEAAGYPTISATDTVPATVPIREAWYSFPTGTDRNNELMGSAVVRFDDPAATANFYEISVYQSGAPGSPRLGQGIVLDVRGNAALAAEDDTSLEPASLVFSDRLFNGQPFELRASFLTHGHSSGGINNGQPVPPRVTGDLRLVLRTVSRAYYQYRKSWTRHLYNQGTRGNSGSLNQLLFLGDPSAMYSNVTNGYGVVVSYAQQTVLLRPR